MAGASPFAKDGLFSRRLDVDGITREELRYLLNEHAEILRDRSQPPPAWLQRLIEAFNYGSQGRPGELSLAAFQAEMPKGNSQSGFLFLAEPLIDDA